MEKDLDGVNHVAGHLRSKELAHSATTGPTVRRPSVSCSVLVGVASGQAETGNGEDNEGWGQGEKEALCPPRDSVSLRQGTVQMARVCILTYQQVQNQKVVNPFLSVT